MNKASDNSIVAQEVDEQLVAYLDGELVDQQRAEVESRLASDESFRNRMKELDQTWDYLNQLPVSDVDEENFARTTVEMIAVAASQEVETYQEQSKKENSFRLIAAFASGILACIVGFFIINYLTSANNNQLLTDLPVIESIDEYQRIEDIEFLELLDKEGLFAEEIESAS